MRWCLWAQAVSILYRTEEKEEEEKIAKPSIQIGGPKNIHEKEISHQNNS